MVKRQVRIACAAVSTALMLLCSGLAFGAQTGSAEPDPGQNAVSAGPVSAPEAVGPVYNLDIIQVIQEQAQSRSTLAQGILSSSMASRYQMILNGSGGECYYLQDVTGDEIPELIAGEGILTVYTYAEGDIKSLGTVSGSNLQYSPEYGILAEELSEGSCQLRSYQFDGELMMATLLLSEKYQTTFEEKAASYRLDADPLISFEVTDRSALGG